MTRFSQVDLDSVAPLHPSNKTAALVAGRGEHFEFEAKNGKIHSDIPLAWRAPSDRELADPTYRDLTGITVGRLKAIGVATEVTSRGNQNWVVRCVCGSYETRKARYIKVCAAGNNPGEEEPMCDWCGKTRKLQRGIGIRRDGPLVKIEGYK
jgi:hypothetical protein